MAELEAYYQEDIQAVNEIPIVAEMLDIICRTTGMGFAAVARVTDDRWIACAVEDKIGFGLLPGGELKLETTICHEIRQHGQPVVFDDAMEDEHYREHHTPKLYGLRSYISVPLILKDGQFFGTLCAIDPQPNVINTKEMLAMFKFYSELLAFHLHSITQLKGSEKQLKEERKIAQLREQFIAILGHDLRNPVGAVRNVAQLLQHGTLDEGNIKRFAAILLNSSHRMNGLIENIMDFARGRLGSGIILERKLQHIENTLKHVIDELQLIWPEQTILSTLDLPGPVYCDEKRVAQLFSNLLGNALTHGDPDGQILISAIVDKGEFLLTVCNSGKQIPQELINHLFEPFSRSLNGKDKEGLGLGLFISSEIARAHNGYINVLSNEMVTTFTFRIPAMD